MSIQKENMIKKIIVAGNYSQLFEQIIEDETIELEKIIFYIFNNIEQIESEVKMKHLAEIIAGKLFKKQSLNDINDQFNLIDDNQSKKNLFKKILSQIGKRSLSHS